MKYLSSIIICFIFCVLLEVSAQKFAICLNNCKDIANPTICTILSNRCQGNTMYRTMCPLTCKVCIPCEDKDQRDANTEKESAGCEVETCKDLAPSDQCFVIKNTIPNGCSIYPQSCRLSCGQCKPCAIPDPHQKCTLDCGDQDDSCSHWKSQGYCKKSSKYYSFTSQNCPMSCGVCKLCSTPKPLNTALPPTAQSCSFDCEDLDESCGHWKKEGFCKQTKKYPHLLKVCAMTCGACKICPTKAPKCSEDCADSHRDCEYWQKQGHCNETSEFPYTREVCPKSCGICITCPEKTTPSTALPPTREQDEKRKTDNT